MPVLPLSGAVILAPMTTAQILHFLNLTPVWLWPLLVWDIARVNRWIAENERAVAVGLYRIATDHRGRLHVEWIAHADAHPPFDLGAPATRIWELRDLDWESRMIEAQDRPAVILVACLGVGSGRDLPAEPILDPG